MKNYKSACVQFGNYMEIYIKMEAKTLWLVCRHITILFRSTKVIGLIPTMGILCYLVLDILLTYTFVIHGH